MIWSSPPHPRYLKNINLSHLRYAPLHIWSTPAGVKIRESIKEARGEFLTSLYTAVTSAETTVAATILTEKIDQWILSLRTFTRQNRSVTIKFRRAADLMIKHRSTNLSYRLALKVFGKSPSMETLVAVRSSLKELYVLKNICDV